MDNPWRNFLPSNFMVHADDVVAVNKHNERSSPEHRFLINMVPEPFVGNPHACVILLMANPGATLDNLKGKFVAENPQIHEASVKNLKHQMVKFPLFHLDPKFAGTEGGSWYAARMRWLIDIVGEKAVANKLMTAELSPYHSLKWKKPRLPIPTQTYTNYLVREAMANKAVVLIARSYKDWVREIPEIERYSRVFRAHSPMNTSVSPGNYGEHAFRQITKAML